VTEKAKIAQPPAGADGRWGCSLYEDLISHYRGHRKAVSNRAVTRQVRVAPPVLE